jgi:hypothetical protein
MSTLVQATAQQYSGGSGIANNVSGHYLGNTQVGSLLLCRCQAQAGKFNPSIPPPPVLLAPSTPGFVWTLASVTTTASAYNYAGIQYLETIAIYYILNASVMGSGISTTVSCTASSSVPALTVGFRLLEYAGIFGALDSTAVADGLNGIPNAGAIVLSGSGLLFVSGTDPQGGADVFQAGAGFSFVGSGGVASAVEEHIVSAAAGNYTAAFATSIAGNWAAVAAAFSVGVVPPPPPPPPPACGQGLPLLDGAGNVRPAQVMLRWSDDGGKTWSSTYLLNCGLVGQYNARPRKTQLGRARKRVWEISGTDPIAWRIANAYVKAEASTE